VDDSGHVNVRLCGISAALQETRVLVSSSEMSVQSSITFTSICTERLFAHNHWPGRDDKYIG